MLAGIPFRRSWGALVPALGLALGACAHRPAMCSRACDDGYACVSGECLRSGNVPDVAAVDRFGLYQARRLVLAPTEVAQLSPRRSGEASSVALLGRAQDGGAMLLLRFSVDLPPDAVVLEAHIVLDRAPSFDADPSPIALHAARIVDPWDERSIAWGRAPRLDEASSPVTTVEPARGTVRIDVRALVKRWRRHAPEDQGIAIIADQATATGMAFALADGGGGRDAKVPVLPVRSLKDSPPTFHAGVEANDGVADAAPTPRGPRLELYVKP